MLDTIYDNP